jgi:malate dehydrogenase (oxaloacetate-decarboxylating)(NADP+)
MRRWKRWADISAGEQAAAGEIFRKMAGLALSVEISMTASRVHHLPTSSGDVMESIEERARKLREAALDYHEFPVPGKIAVTPTKQLINQRDLSLAYSPGVAFACEEIVENPLNAARFTARGNLVGVVSNGSAVLGLGNIGPLASKPVMEGKAVLLKKFAGIDVFDIELDESDPHKLADIITALEPTFGGVILEDIKAPECFTVERECRRRMSIPVFHDDQHGTAIVVAAAVLNGLKVVGKKLEEVKVVVSGAGAAALACLNLLVDIGLQHENIFVTDLAGVVYKGRTELMDPDKEQFARDTDARSLAEVIDGADVFLGLSAGGVLKQEMVKRMADKPLILALANPTPEIMPEVALEVRPDAVLCTGRTDYPNQVNNVLVFPFLFRGALDVGATSITKEMEIAAVRAIADLARQEQSDIVAAAYGVHDISFGPDYLIPKPFDPRLIVKIAPAVARAAMESGVALRPIEDMQAYEQHLHQFVYRSGAAMKPVFQLAHNVAPEKKRVVFAEGEEERVLRAVQIVVDEKLATPILIGRAAVIEQRIRRYGLRLVVGRDFTVVDTDRDERYRDFWQTYAKMMARKGITPQMAKLEMRRRTTLIGAMLVKKGEADGMICGTVSTTHRHLHFIDQVIGKKEGCSVYAAMNALVLADRQIFVVDTHVNVDPTAEQLAEITLLAADEVRRFGVEPKVALCSHSNFGTSLAPSAQKMRDLLAILKERAPTLQVDGEMHGDLALDANLREETLGDSKLDGEANLLVMPNLDAANISYNLLKSAAGGNVAIGPMLLGVAKPVHVLSESATVRRIVNITAVLVGGIAST